MRPDHGVPATPQFWSDLEGRLRTKAARRRRRRLPVATTALRALRTLSTTSIHVLAAAGLGAFLLLATPSGDLSSPSSAVPSAPTEVDRSVGTPPAPSAADLARAATAQGFEVTITSTFVDDHRHDGRVLEIRHVGASRTDLPPTTGVKGLIEIVVGTAVADQGSFAT